jgi:anhydro-N-acetylmuramic acid kinase
MAELYIGLMSGTSADGVNAALVDLALSQPKLIATQYNPYPDRLRHAILDLYQPGPDEINRLGEIDILIGNFFAATTHELLHKNAIDKKNIRAIGSHGQTIRHQPQKKHPFTLQIGDPNVIATETGIPTVADFRRRDMAWGGQGAPLVPAFHHHIFSSHDKDRIIVNIGGIANITVLPKDKSQAIIGYDTGPGNALLDAWIEKNLQQSHDEKGSWSAKGTIQPALLNSLLQDPYFSSSHPKSTGREYFHLAWLQKHLSPSYSAIDVQTTLVELTAITILNAIKNHFAQADIFICGGGVHNAFLMTRLQTLGNSYEIESTQTFGIDPDWVEAMAFAWLAQQTLQKKPGNLPSVTGAKQQTILGGIYY